MQHLKMRPNKTDRNDPAGLPQIVRTGWFKQIRIKGRDSYEIRSLLTAREVLVRTRVKLENETRGLLRTFGVLFGRAAGCPACGRDRYGRAHQGSRPAVLAAAKRNSTAWPFMTAPGVSAITALSVVSAFDDAARFRSSPSAGAYLRLTPQRYESGEVSRNGHISKHGNSMTRKHLYKAASTLLTRTTAFSALKAWRLRLAKTSGFKKARVAVARKLAVTLHAMW
jgi:transposase